ncbi:hypothetical protein AC578_1721 [Pseudocercospora eumusae]|uniref:DUF7726 domain-containing protein n=1 Tax=Pseudocercospora eumusae TaxID=321146 RepID=A0A139H020_9PEZI|nr:hypothetical protein AC578_1721 [Pseudocercospora eumusae]
MPPAYNAGQRAILRDVTNETLAAAEEYFKTDDYQAYLRKTGGKSTAKAASKSVTGSKRKSQEAQMAQTDVDLDDIDVDDMYVDKSCNQVRGQIRRLLDSGEMKVGEFCAAIGVSNKSLNDFLRQNGTMKGSGSATYSNAWAYFKKRELAGIKAPTKRAKTTSAAESSASTTVSLSGIFLDGEDTGSVKIYDTCDEIRKKISAHLTKPGITQAQFCRDLAAQLHTGVNIQSKQLTDFRNKKGARAGNTSSVFYAAYVYFEKLRLAEGKPKSKHRQEMEAAWPNGFDIVHGTNRGYWCFGNERPHEDKLGRVTFH